MKAVQDFFDENEYLQVHTPILTSNDCEGAGETFLAMPSSESLIEKMRDDNMEIQSNSSADVFFDHKSYLTVSSQLHLEAAARYFLNQ